MATNQFNIGKDVSISIVGPAGALTQLGLLREFEMRPVSRTLKSIPINNKGIPVVRNTYQGWEGHAIYDRQQGNLDLLHNILEANFYDGNPDILFQISETIRNADGTVDRFIYLDCAVAMENAGGYRQDDMVEQRVRIESPQRIGG